LFPLEKPASRTKSLAAERLWGSVRCRTVSGTLS
jgi:hypothetical protein